MARVALHLADHRIEMVYLLSNIFDQSTAFRTFQMMAIRLPNLLDRPFLA